MNTTRQKDMKPHQELYYRKSQAGEFVFVRSVHTPATGDQKRAAAGDFYDDVGVKASQICLLNLKLQLESSDDGISSEYYRVLDGNEAGFFAQTVNAMFKGENKGSKWYRILFGDKRRIFFVRGSGAPFIIIPKSNTYYPRTIDVYLVKGFPDEDNVIPITQVKSIQEIIVSLGRQIQELRQVTRRWHSSTQSTKNPQADNSITHRRSERAWGVLEQYVRDLTNNSLPWNRLYAIDRQNDAVWNCAETYAYLGLQTREYMKANYCTQEKKWKITFPKPVLDAINQAAEIAKIYLPNHRKHDHSLTAFEDWRYPQEIAKAKPKFEIVRVLIWPTDRLLSEEAFAVLRLHKIYNIPLFYLTPDFVDGEPEEEYILFCKPKDTENTKQNELRGMAWDAARRDWKSVSDLNFHPLDHFYKLLKNPKLVFVIDARKMLSNGIWDSFQTEVANSNET